MITLTSTINITSATVLQGQGADTVILTTTLPLGMWPYVGYAQVKMEVACGCGPDYVRTHLEMEPQVINMNG